MKKYVVKRLLHALPILVGITLLTFLIMKLAPGNSLTSMVNPHNSAASIEKAEKALGMDQPVIVQYFRWLGEILRLNFGYSANSGQPVLQMILSRLPATLLLTCTAFLFSYLIGIPLGVYSATHKYTPGDYSLTVFSFIGVSIPSFFFGMGLIYIFAFRLKWFPTSGFGSDLFEGNAVQLALNKLRYLVLPAAALALPNIATVVRFTRSSMVDSLSQDYIRTARAKGLSEKIVVYRHALRNSLIPLITIIGLSVPNLFGGTYIIEKVFNWPGMGLLGVDAIGNRDYPLLMGINLITSALVLLGNLFSDVLYAYVDPRIRY